MLTYQDFLKADDRQAFIVSAIYEHKNSEDYKIANDADLYDCQMNKTISDYQKVLYTITGSKAVDFTASNAKIASNFFHRLNTQRVTYLLGNGVMFRNGGDETKSKLGSDFDTRLKDLAYNGLIHKVGFGFWNYDQLYVFPYTEFVPLMDEETGALRAGIRYWQLDRTKPLFIVLYEEDGFTKYRKSETANPLEVIMPKRAYKQTIAVSEAGGEEIIGESNYGSLPIIPLWGNKRHKSSLVGMQKAIDSYDLIRSGFANDLTDVAQIYWLIENAAGMDDDDIQKFLDDIKLRHIAKADTSGGSKVTPYTQEIPYQARKQYLDDIRSQIYEDYGGLDVHTIAAGATNDHIDAAYQPVDEEADDFEFQVTQFIKQLLKLIGVEDEPLYKRNRISNELEQVQMVMQEAQYLDDETILKKLPNITVDEVEEILKRKDAEDIERFGTLIGANEGSAEGDQQNIDNNPQAQSNR